MPDVFLSYASADRERARVLAEALGRRGYDVWWDRTIPPGRVFDEVIQEALQAARCIVVLWSGQSVRSNWVKTEAGEGAAQGKLVPALIEAVAPPIEFKRIQAANLAGWSGDEDNAEFRTLIAAIEDRLRHPGTPVGTAAGTPPPRLDNAPPLPGRSSRFPLLAIAGALVVVGILVAVATQWLPRRAEQTSLPAQAPSAGSRDTTAPGAPTSAGAGATPSAPGARPVVIAASGRINLLARENGGELITASSEHWALTIDGKDETYAWIENGEAVFGFRDGRGATFDTFAVLIPGTSDTNLRDFELLAGNEPGGRFQSIGTFSTQNLRIMKNPHQEFRFAPVKAKYLKFRSLKNHSGGAGAVTGYEFRLYGTLD